MAAHGAGGAGGRGREVHTRPVRTAAGLIHAAIAQLGERQTEDLKVPSSILGLGIIACGV